MKLIKYSTNAQKGKNSKHIIDIHLQLIIFHFNESSNSYDCRAIKIQIDNVES